MTRHTNRPDMDLLHSQFPEEMIKEFDPSNPLYEHLYLYPDMEAVSLPTDEEIAEEQRFSGWEHEGSSAYWFVTDLWNASKGLEVKNIPLEELLDQVESYHNGFELTDFIRARRADLNYPIIVISTPTNPIFILDGYHRIYKAMYLEKQTHIQAVFLDKMPLPARLHGKPFYPDELDFEWKIKDSAE